MADKLDAAIRDEMDGITTRWFLVAETMTNNGTQTLQTATSDELASWDVIGMLQAARLMAEQDLRADDE